MNRRSEGNPCEALAKGFEQNRVFAHMFPSELYGKWLEATWAFLEAAQNPQGFRECLDRYSHAEGLEFGRLLGVYMDAVEAKPFRDVLGDLFMRLDANAARNGQVFTPWDVAEMMARMQFERASFEELVREKGEVSVCDPAVGSGALLLAFAKVVHDEMGRWGVNKLRLYGTDIDRRCVLMCRIQLRMNGLDAFGRMAGLLTAILETDPSRAPTAEQTAGPVPAASAAALGVPEPHDGTDLSQAVILRGEEWQEEEGKVAKECALF